MTKSGAAPSRVPLEVPFGGTDDKGAGLCDPDPVTAADVRFVGDER